MLLYCHHHLLPRPLRRITVFSFGDPHPLSLLMHRRVSLLSSSSSFSSSSSHHCVFLRWSSSYFAFWCIAVFLYCHPHLHSLPLRRITAYSFGDPHPLSLVGTLFSLSVFRLHCHPHRHPLHRGHKWPQSLRLLFHLLIQMATAIAKFAIMTTPQQRHRALCTALGDVLKCCSYIHPLWLWDVNDATHTIRTHQAFASSSYLFYVLCG